MRATLVEFAIAVEKKLQQNDHKGGWENDTLLDLIKRLNDEIGELVEAYARIDVKGIAAEAVDVAAFAMMLYDNAMKEAKRDPVGTAPKV